MDMMKTDLLRLVNRFIPDQSRTETTLMMTTMTEATVVTGTKVVAEL
jgi:hypothetical protein